MRKIFIFALLLLMFVSNALAGNFDVAPPIGNWNKVQTLPPEANIVIEIKYGGQFSGEFIRLTEDSILMRDCGRDWTYRKNEVERIRWLRPGSRARMIGIVSGILFGVGFGVGYASAANVADRNSMPPGERAAIGAAMGAAFSGAGALITMGSHPEPRGELIYRAR